MKRSKCGKLTTHPLFLLTSIVLFSSLAHGQHIASGYTPVPLVSAEHPVQWWFVFKLNAASFPGCGSKITCRFGGEPQSYKTGYGLQYAYASSEDPSLKPGSKCAGNSVDDPIGATFDQVYNGSSYYVLWNDQFYADPAIPSCASLFCSAPWGTSKGMLSWNAQGEGFVMQVSTPSWPASGSAANARQTDGNTLGCVKDNNTRASQSFFSLKLSKDDMVKVLTALVNASVVTDPTNRQIVNNGGPPEIQQLVRQLGVLSRSTSYTDVKLTSGVRLISKPSQLQVPPWPLLSAILGGVSIKAATWFAAPQMPETMAYTSISCWPQNLRGPGRVEPADVGYWEGKNFSLAGGASSDSNHAKFGVSTGEDQDLVIFGDLNEQGMLSGNCSSSQNGRGGLFFVVEDRGLADSVKSVLGVPVNHRNLGASSWAWIMAHGGNWIYEHRAETYPTLATILVLLLLPSRLVMLLLAQDVLLINKLAPWFYLTSIGQRKLFRSYRVAVVSNKEIRDDGARYVDLPYTSNKITGGKRLSVEVLDLLMQRRGIGIVSEGGRGKTALCRHVTMAILRDLRPSMRRMQPVLIDGLAYTGNLLNAVVDALQQSHAYVNKTIVESQLSMGNLLIIFDGLSEIRESYREAGEMTDIPAFIRQHPDTPLLFTSRSPLPANILHAMNDAVTVELKDIDTDTEKEFLGQYLKRGLIEADAVIQQMNERLGEMPRIPLMLKLVAAVYDETGSVPKDRPELLSQYADQLLRPVMIGASDPSGFRFALRYLVRETFLKNGGDRGFPIDEGVRLLGSVREDLKNYDLTLSPIEIINLVCRAGVLRRNGDYCRFFHDSFESYFGARSLLIDFQRRQYTLVIECQRNERVKESYDFFLHMLNPLEELPRLLAIIPSVPQ
jgi:hypothetical protein